MKKLSSLLIGLLPCVTLLLWQCTNDTSILESQAFSQSPSAQKVAADIIVAKDGSGNFTTIQAAINSLSTSATTTRTIYIKNGTYSEKLSLENRNFVTLIGESRAGVIVTISQSRDKWLCANANNDWGVATINVRNCTDLVLQNMTVYNTYGKDVTTNVTISCPIDASGSRTVTPTGHQMALRTASGVTRLKVLSVTFRSYGGDTVSPWETTAGMYYFQNCTIEGGVDMYCPRGWSYATGCKFINHNTSAAIWHDGSSVKTSKTVLNSCTFSGDNNFKLGRYHTDAQFYILNSTFDNNIANAKIYQASTTALQWGERVYYYNSHRTGGDYTWHANNITSTVAAAVTPSWTFDGKWDPTK